MTKVKHTAETAEAEAVEQGLKAHYAMCKKIDELESEIDKLTTERQQITEGLIKLHNIVLPPIPNAHTIGAIGTLAERLKESANKEPF